MLPSLPLTALDGTRTVDRRLVHRTAVSEVFLTDVARLGETSFAVAVHVPPHHHYYADHSSGRSTIDPLFLLEAARQAQACVAHEHLEVPLDHRFVVRSIRLTRRARLSSDAVTASCSTNQVVLDVEVTDLVTVRGELRSATFRSGVWLRTRTDVSHVADVVIAMSYVPARSYDFLRGETVMRGAAHDVHDTEGDLRAAAVSVGRRRHGNVLLEAPRHEVDGSTAVLRPAYDNLAMFDHAQDHVPAMVLVEAARQLVLHRLGAGTSDLGPLDGLDVGTIIGTFHAFVEHSPPALIRLALPGQDDADEAERHAFEVAVVEAGTATVLADLSVAMTPAVGNASRRDRERT